MIDVAAPMQRRSAPVDAANYRVERAWWPEFAVVDEVAFGTCATRQVARREP